RLRGAQFAFEKITVTGTEDIMMAAALAEGETVLENCAREPEVEDLACLLNKMGAKVTGAGSPTIKIQGVSRLRGAKHRIIPDRIEAGTFIVAGAITGGDVNVANCEPKHQTALTAKLREVGVEIRENGDSVRVIGRDIYKASDITTLEYPGFATD